MENFTLCVAVIVTDLSNYIWPQKLSAK